MVLGGVVLCGLLFLVSVLVRYFEAAKPLKQAVPELRTSTEAKRIRLAEYEQQISDLRDAIPRDGDRLSRTGNWIELLTQQYKKLQTLQVERDRSEIEKQISDGESKP
jgi:cell division protein FtsL